MKGEMRMNGAGGLALVSILGIGMAGGAPQKKKKPGVFVAPNIGGIGQLLKATVPYVQCPYGMARVAPVTTPGIADRYLADKIYGFPAGPGLLMGADGPQKTKPADYASDFDHDFETATPYYYQADLQTWKIKAETTTTQQAAYYRFTYPAGPHGHLVLSLHNHAEFTVAGPKAVEGSEQVGGDVAELADPGGETREYFYIEFSAPQSSWQTWQNGAFGHEAKINGDDIGYVTDTVTTAGETIEVRVGLSYISADQARRNLEREIPQWGFDAVKEQTRAVWNRTLGAVATVGGTERQRTIFYTALYRSLGRMTDITEDGRYFSGYDHQVHSSEGHDFYVDDGLWDTYRSLHPLQTLLDAQRQEDMARSYIR